METRTMGYNITLKLNSKKVMGTTDNDFGIDAETKESLIKDDLGKSQIDYSGYKATLGISGLSMTTDETEPTKLTQNDLISAIVNKTKIPFVYSRVGSTATIEGNLVITKYSESSGSSDHGKWTVSTQVDGDLTFGTLQV